MSQQQAVHLNYDNNTALSK